MAQVFINKPKLEMGFFERQRAQKTDRMPNPRNPHQFDSIEGRGRLKLEGRRPEKQCVFYRGYNSHLHTI